MNCKIYRFLYKIIPIERWRAYLMGTHLAVCHRCKEEYAADFQMETIGTRPETVAPDFDLWERIQERLIVIENSKEDYKKINAATRRYRWAWALTGAAVLLLALLIPLKLFHHADHQGRQDNNGQKDKKIIINSVTVERQPAETIYFHPGDKDRLIVWVKRM